MIIIAFSNKTSKIIPQLLCCKLKHVAPIVPCDNKLIMYQFVSPVHTEKIVLQMRDIKILQSHGWKFVYIDGAAMPHDFDSYSAYSCVDLTKHALGIKNWRIQTPCALYKNLSN